MQPPPGMPYAQLLGVPSGGAYRGTLHKPYGQGQLVRESQTCGGLLEAKLVRAFICRTEQGLR